MVSLALTILSSIISIILNNQKSKKTKLVEIAKIAQKTTNYVIEAESVFGSGHGTAKLAYVLNKIQMDCIAHKVEYKENEWKGEIEQILSTPQKKDEKGESEQ